MIRVSVIYPAGEGKTFDMDYYKNQHMAIVDRVMPGLVKREIDEGVDGLLGRLRPRGVVVDIKSMLKPEQVGAGYDYWSL